jgi:hypothetical protein
MDGHYGNAMTEIALALAMAFFSVMVLAMVSMGAGSSGASKAVATANETLRVVPSKPATSPQATAGKGQIIVFYKGQYLSDQLKPLDPAEFGPEETIILAIDPALPLSGALKARAALNSKNITVTVLDPRWMRTLEETEQ